CEVTAAITATTAHWTSTRTPSTIHTRTPISAAAARRSGAATRSQGRFRTEVPTAAAQPSLPVGIHRRVLAVPGDRAGEALAQRRPPPDPERRLGPRGVEGPPRLAVRHRAVPHELTVEAGQVGDRLGERPDRDLGAGSDVDGPGLVVPVGGEDERLGRVL